jgi:hypothetical protein
MSQYAKFSKGGQLEDKSSNWRTWRTNCHIGGRPPDWRTFVLYATNQTIQNMPFWLVWEGGI